MGCSLTPTEGPGPGVDANVSLEWAATGVEKERLYVQIQAVCCGTPCATGAGACSDYSIRVHGRHAWRAAGRVSTAEANTSTCLVYEQLSQTQHRVCVKGGHAIARNVVAAPLSPEEGVIASSSDESWSTVGSSIHDGSRQPMQADESFAAVASSIYWTYVYTPAEQGALLPVSRGWSMTEEVKHVNAWAGMTFHSVNLSSYTYNLLCR